MLFRTLLVLLAIVAAGGCVSSDQPPPPQKVPATATTATGWAPENKEKLLRFLKEHGCESAGYDAARPPCATFDWDMTSIFNDIGEATFYFQVRNFALKLTLDELDALLPNKFAAEKKETLQAFEKRDANLFAYRMVWFYNKLEEVDGPLVAYPWLVKLYKNLLPSELARLSERVLAHELRKPGEKCTTIELTHATEPPIKIRHGIVDSPEMKELYSLLRLNGFDVYVVTASFQGAVQPFAMRYGVRPDHVIGMRLTVRPDGSLSDEVLEPFTYRKGKVQAIAKFVPSPPLFAAGDSDTDVEMLLQESVQLRLVLDRKKNPTSDIGKLYERARVSDREHWMIQGRDDYGADGTASGTWNGTTETRLDR